MIFMRYTGQVRKVKFRNLLDWTCAQNGETRSAHRILEENHFYVSIILSQLLKKNPAFYTTQKLITMFTESNFPTVADPITNISEQMVWECSITAMDAVYEYVKAAVVSALCEEALLQYILL
jgi:hypothetical protein